MWSNKFLEFQAPTRYTAMDQLSKLVVVGAGLLTVGLQLVTIKEKRVKQSTG